MRRWIAFIVLMVAWVWVLTHARQVWAVTGGFTSTITRTGGYLTTVPPTITNPTVTVVATLVTGNPTNLLYRITNEDTTNGIRCQYGTPTGTAPVTTPTAAIGFLIPAGSTYVETTVPQNRLDCIAVAGSPKASVTVYQ